MCARVEGEWDVNCARKPHRIVGRGGIILLDHPNWEAFRLSQEMASSPVPSICGFLLNRGEGIRGIKERIWSRRYERFSHTPPGPPARRPFEIMPPSFWHWVHGRINRAAKCFHWLNQAIVEAYRQHVQTLAAEGRPAESHWEVRWRFVPIDPPLLRCALVVRKRALGRSGGLRPDTPIGNPLLLLVWQDDGFHLDRQAASELGLDPDEIQRAIEQPWGTCLLK